MFDFTEIVTIIAVTLALAFGWAWRRAVSHEREREQRWRRALDAVAWRDYGRARALAEIAEMTEKQPHNVRDEPFYISLRRMVDRLEQQDLEGREGQAARREWEDVVASLQDAVLVIDEELRLRFLNVAATQMFGVKIEDVLGAQLIEALPGFELDAAVRAAITEGRSNSRAVSLYSPQLREVLLRVSPVRRSTGQISGAVAIIQDMTELRRLERVRRDFVANASHELRTPIANIRASAETILDSPDDPNLIQRFLPQLVHEAERLSRLVSDLLDLARADAQADAQIDDADDKTGEARKVSMDLSAVVHSVVEQLRDKAAQQEIAVECTTQPAMVNGDASALEQVVLNLLDNALIYTPAGGAVQLRVGCSSKVLAVKENHAPQNSNGDQTQHWVTLQVSDNGNGIPPEDLPRVFERFYRADKARSRAQGGTGLGLAIAKHIVENHNGHIAVESEIEQGTTFTVSLPAVSKSFQPT